MSTVDIATRVTDFSAFKSQIVAVQREANTLIGGEGCPYPGDNGRD